MKSITFKEIVNQLNHPDYSHTLLISDRFEEAGKAEAMEYYTDGDTLGFCFEVFHSVAFKRDSMNAKTDGSSIFLTDQLGTSYELRMFKVVQISF